MIGDAPRRAWLWLYSRWLRGAIMHGPMEQKVSLTFDDGPSDRWTPKILEILAKYDARATFFMVGEQIEKFPDVAREVASQGHELAVHLFSHQRSVADDDESFQSELLKTRDLIQTTTGVQPVFLRFPFAYLGRQRPRRILAEIGLHTVHWSFSSMDSRGDSTKTQRIVKNALFPGAIVLLHDGVGQHSKYSKDREATIHALPEVLKTCRERALVPVGLSEMLPTHTKG